MKNYESPAIRVIELHTEGMLAASGDNDFVVVDPNNPNNPATKDMYRGWNSAAWE